MSKPRPKISDVYQVNGVSEEVSPYLGVLLPRLRDIGVILKSRGEELVRKNRWFYRLFYYPRYRRLYLLKYEEVIAIQRRHPLSLYKKRYRGYLNHLEDMLEGRLNEIIRVPRYWRYVPYAGERMQILYAVLSLKMGHTMETVLTRTPKKLWSAVLYLASYYREGGYDEAVGKLDLRRYKAAVRKRKDRGTRLGLSELGVLYVPVVRKGEVSIREYTPFKSTNILREIRKKAKGIF